MDFLLGSGPQTTRLPKFDQRQMGGINQLLSMGLQGLQNPQLSQFREDLYNFDPIRQQAQQQFMQKTIPGIAERFTQLGAGGGRSSAFGQQLGAAGADLATNLGALESQFNLQKAGQFQNWQNSQLANLMNMAQLGLTPQFDTIYQPQQGGFLQGLGNVAARLAPIGLGFALGGPPGAVAGAGLSAGMGSLFGQNSNPMQFGGQNSMFNSPYSHGGNFQFYRGGY